MANATAPAAPALDFVSLGGNFLLVIALLVAVLWALRRFQSLQGLQGLRATDRRLAVVETLNVGPRQKVALIRVDGREVLVGVSPTHFTLLQDLPSPPAMRRPEAP